VAFIHWLPRARLNIPDVFRKPVSEVEIKHLLAHYLS
jgi:hypothetical protein